LGRYIASFHDDGVELKVFLNEEISRLKNIISKSADDEEISQNPILLENAKRVLSLMEGYREQNITSQMIEQVLKIQSLAREMQN
jgi:6-phosphogluconolactonase/glucosamine-6-phosphate isomerase/deaminase